MQLESIRLRSKYRIFRVFCVESMQSTESIACLRLDSFYSISMFDSNHFYSGFLCQIDGVNASHSRVSFG